MYSYSELLDELGCGTRSLHGNNDDDDAQSSLYGNTYSCDDTTDCNTSGQGTIGVMIFVMVLMVLAIVLVASLDGAVPLAAGRRVKGLMAIFAVSIGMHVLVYVLMDNCNPDLESFVPGALIANGPLLDRDFEADECSSNVQGKILVGMVMTIIMFISSIISWCNLELASAVAIIDAHEIKTNAQKKNILQMIQKKQLPKQQAPTGISGVFSETNPTQMALKLQQMQKEMEQMKQMQQMQLQIDAMKIGQASERNDEILGLD